MSWWTKKELHPKIKSKFVVVFSDVFYLPNVKSINKPSVEIETKEYRLLNHTFNYPGNAKWKPVTLKFVDMNGMGSKTEFFDTSAFLWQILNNTGYAYPNLDNSAIRNPHYTNVDTKDGKALTTSGGHHISTQIAFRDDPKTPLKEHNTWRTITTPEKSSNIANSFGAGLEGKIDKLPASPSRQRIAIYQISPGEKPVITEAWYLVNPIVKSINWGDLSYDSEDLVEYELQIVYDWAVLDRTVIGDVLEVDEKPYQQFMKTLKSNKDSIKQEVKLQESIEKLKEELQPDAFGNVDPFGDLETLTQDLNEIRDLQDRLRSADPTDLDGDGIISNEERALWEDQNGKGMEELREMAAEAEAEIMEARKEAYLDREEEQRQEQERIQAEQEELDQRERDEAELHDIDFTDAKPADDDDTLLDINLGKPEDLEFNTWLAEEQDKQEEQIKDAQEHLEEFRQEQQEKEELDRRIEEQHEQITDTLNTILQAEAKQEYNEFVEELDNQEREIIEARQNLEEREEARQDTIDQWTEEDTSRPEPDNHEENMQLFNQSTDQAQQIANELGFESYTSVTIDGDTGTITGVKDGETMSQTFTIED
jgi:hypothetical protein